MLIPCTEELPLVLIALDIQLAIIRRGNSRRLVYSVKSDCPGSKIGIKCHGRWEAGPGVVTDGSLPSAPSMDMLSHSKDLG